MRASLLEPTANPTNGIGALYGRRAAAATPALVATRNRRYSPFSCTHCGSERYSLVLHAEALTNRGGLRLMCSGCEVSFPLSGL
ncbi:MAG: hypothetical protein U0172_11740 [Nitrospiraceae bacterium]